MKVIEQIGLTGLVPVVVINNAQDAVPTAEALLKANINLMEITLRTAAGLEAIKRVSEECPEMLVGAGTVLSVQKAEAAKNAGAKFIVSPGFNIDVVNWCIENEMPVTPGCVTPTEIENALSFGLRELKFFPADVYGGVKGMKALYGPYKSTGLRFIPTGGVNLTNLKEYVTQPFIHAVGGGFLCKTEDIENHNFELITKTAEKAVEILLGFEFDHVGINTPSAESSEDVLDFMEKSFGFERNPGNSSNYSGSSMEITKQMGLGKNGHLGIKTNNLKRALYYLSKRGVEIDMETAKYKGEKMIAVYLKERPENFAIHIVEK